MLYTQLEVAAKDYHFYIPRRQEYLTQKHIPFRVSPTPFYISQQDFSNVMNIGETLLKYFISIEKLYEESHIAKSLLDKGKPDFFLKTQSIPNYLFFRPDLIQTVHGFRICEIETSPFGLGLSHFLHNTYESLGYNFPISSQVLPMYIQKNIPKEGEIVFTEKTKSYRGQLEYLADHVFSGSQHRWSATHILQSTRLLPIYRAFYLSEYTQDSSVKVLLDKNAQPYIPTCTPYMEEKMILSFIWDKRFVSFFQKEIGDKTVSILQSYIPPTWIVGQEEYCISPVCESLNSLSKIPREKRQYVVKVSGFNAYASWCEDVNFLHQMSKQQVLDLELSILSDEQHTYITQVFTPAEKHTAQYEDENEIKETQVKTRITPYFSTKDGSLLTMKATSCEHTDYIHASTSSINAPIAIHS